MCTRTLLQFASLCSGIRTDLFASTNRRGIGTAGQRGNPTRQSGLGLADDFFWVFYADVLNRADLEAMLRMHRKRKPAATLGVYEVADPRRCGIVATEDSGVIKQFVESPDSQPATSHSQD